MILVDTALERRHREDRPVRVGLVGAGYIGRGIARQVILRTPGMRIVAIANRTLDKAARAYTEAGAEAPVIVETIDALNDAISGGRNAITSDPTLLAGAHGVDAILEATGDVEAGARLAVAAIAGGKHLILMNSELDALVGPLLKSKADRAGVVYTNADGDQPGVTMNLFRFVKTIGLRPVLAGNIKGMLDFYRTPETQRAFAEKYLQDAKMVTSFADGTKLAFEQAVVANATGFGVARPGMHGPACKHVSEAIDLFPLDDLLGGGIVDYVLGAEPGPGVFVLGYDDDPIRMQYMPVYKMGDGPLHVFYTPYHLPHLEPVITVARAVLFGDAAVAPIGAPVCEVVSTAKRALRAGETLDGIGGFTCYGVIYNAVEAREAGYLPMSLLDGCTLRTDIPRDQPLRYADVVLPTELVAANLRREQDLHFHDDSPVPLEEVARLSALEV